MKDGFEVARVTRERLHYLFLNFLCFWPSPGCSFVDDILSARRKNNRALRARFAREIFFSRALRARSARYEMALTPGFSPEFPRIRIGLPPFLQPQNSAEQRQGPKKTPQTCQFAQSQWKKHLKKLNICEKHLCFATCSGAAA